MMRHLLKQAINKRVKGLQKTILKNLHKFKNSAKNSSRKNMIRRSEIDACLTVGYSKGKARNYDNYTSVEDEKQFYEEQKALLDEEMNEFEEEEFETELPRRISEAIKALNKRMKELKRDEFGDQIIDEGYLQQHSGKNLQLSALRLANLMNQLLKKNPLPEFKSQLVSF